MTKGDIKVKTRMCNKISKINTTNIANFLKAKNFLKCLIVKTDITNYKSKYVQNFL